MDDAALLAAFISQDESARACCERLLEAHPSRAAIVLLRALETGDRSARARASRMFGLCDDSVVPELMTLASSANSVVRFWAAASLGRLGPRASQAVPALSALLSDPVSGVRKAAALALGQMLPLPLDTVTDLLAAFLSPTLTSRPLRESLVGVLLRVELDQPRALRSVVGRLPATRVEDAEACVAYLERRAASLRAVARRPG